MGQTSPAVAPAQMDIITTPTNQNVRSVFYIVISTMFAFQRPYWTSDLITDLPAWASTANSYYADQQHHSQIPPHAQMGYGHATSNGSHVYYAPSHQPSGSSYGHVYYPTAHGGDGGGTTTLDSRNHGINALNTFYYDAQRGAFDPKSYTQVESRLMAISGSHFPFLSNGSITDYRATGSPAGHGGPQVGVLGPSPQYLLPAMNHLRTKNDLLAVDQIMEQAQATIYEHPSQMAAAGLGHLAQPDAYHVPSTSDSPPSGSPPPMHPRFSPHAHAPSAPHLISTPTPSRDSPPALTPTDSTKSFTSGHSPLSRHSSGGVSPVTTGSMYPTLPGTSTAAMSSGVFRSSAAPASTLGNQFQGDEFLRMRSGQLHRGRQLKVEAEVRQPGPPQPLHPKDETELADDPVARRKPGASSTFTEQEKQARTRARPRSIEISASMIDPALSGVMPPSAGEMDEKEIKADENWVMMARTIENLRSWIQRRVEHGDFEPEEEHHGEHELSQERRKSTPSLYPVLGELQTAA